jgi:hypothetical protein
MKEKSLKTNYVDLDIVWKLSDLQQKFAIMKRVLMTLTSYNGANLTDDRIFKVLQIGMNVTRKAIKEVTELKDNVNQFVK